MKERSERKKYSTQGQKKNITDIVYVRNLTSFIYTVTKSKQNPKGLRQGLSPVNLKFLESYESNYKRGEAKGIEVWRKSSKSAIK